MKKYSATVTFRFKRGDNMTTTTLQKIKAYGKSEDKQDILNLFLDYYGKDSFEKISEEMAIAFLEKLETGEIKVEGV